MIEVLFGGFIVLLLIVAILFAVLARAVSLYGKLIKALLVVLVLLTAIPLGIFEFGEPLAGVLYLVTARYAMSALFVVTAVLLALALRRGESRAFIGAASALAAIAAAASWLAPLMVVA